jgi:hypothetical protein
MLQIWKLTYDIEDAEGSSELTLLYNNNVGVSVDHPIEAVARYENADIQRVYWTDNFNPLRRCNIKDDALFAVPEDLLSLSPQATLEPAIPEGLAAGNLPSGVWQVGYKLSKEGGAKTATSKFSNPIRLTATEEQKVGKPDYELYTQSPPTIPTEKSIKYVINNLDPGFDTIDIYAIKRGSGGLYEAWFMYSDDISQVTEYDFEIANTDEAEPVGIEDVLDFDVDFERVKTITIKDNALLVGNVKESTFELDFDARAYRFKYQGEETHNGYNLTSSTGLTYDSIPEDDDAINPFNDDFDTNFNLDPQLNYRYQRNSNELGGTGKNISYKFTTQKFNLDETIGYPGANTTDPIDAPFSAVDYSTNNVTLDSIDYNLDSHLGDYKNPFIAGSFAGYMRDEVYRFGIVFYSKTGKAADVKWIGDIRMPIASDVIDTASGKTAIVIENQSNSINMYALGIEFTVDVSDIKDKISGFSIVRSPRKEKDKTIVAQGRLGDLMGVSDTVDGARLINRTGAKYDTESGDNYDSLNAGALTDAIFNKVVEYNVKDRFTFDAPDTKFLNGAKIDANETYYIKPVGLYKHLGGNINGQTIRREDSDGELLVPTSYYSNYRKDLQASTDGSPITFYNYNRFTVDLLGKIKAQEEVNQGKVDVDVSPVTLSSGGTVYSKFTNRGYILKVVGDYDNGLLAGLGAILDKWLVASPGTHTYYMETANSDAYNYMYNAFSSITGSLSDAVRRRNTIIGNLYRRPDKQYGGNTYRQRENSEYISTGNFIPVDITASSKTTDVYGGDIFITANTDKKLYSETASWTLPLEGGSAASFTIDSPVLGTIYPTENAMYAPGRNGNNLNTLKNLADAQINDQYILDPVYSLDRGLQKFLITGSGTSNNTEIDNRIYMSEQKANGELSDAWSIFRPLNYMDVDGHYGPINKLETLNDNVLFFQNNAFGVVAVNPRSVIQDADGGALELGTGTGLVDYKYISNSAGSRHQFGVVKSRKAIYFFDASQRKFYRFTGQDEPLSDVKGMSSFFFNDVVGTILELDNPLTGVGIHGTYDYRFNEILYTFKGINAPRASDVTSGPTAIGSTSTANTDVPVNSEHTIVFNELVDGFTGFYDIAPTHYINDTRNIFTNNPEEQDQIYLHNVGDYGSFYDTYYPSVVNLVVNPKGDHTKVFNNLEFLSQVTDTNGNDEYNDTLNTIQVYNEYQDSGEITLTPDDNVRRRMRTWRLQIPRDGNARIRNPYTNVKLTYTNEDDKRIILNDIITYYMNTPM